MEDALFTSLTVVVGLIVLLAAYALIPLCIAFLSKTPIVKKLYSTLCIANATLVCLIITAAVYSDEPFFSITLAIACSYVAYRIGLSRLGKKNLLLGDDIDLPKHEKTDVNTPEPTYVRQPPVEYEQLEITVGTRPDEDPKPEPTTEQKKRKTALFVSFSVILIAAALAGGHYWGRQVGYSVGLEAGYDGGYSTGYGEGHDAGYDSGSNAGFNKGYSAGYSDGKLSVKVKSSTGTSTVVFNNNVCISDGGYSYHYGWCPYLGDKVVVSLSDAKAAGYTRCSFCNPPA